MLDGVGNQKYRGTRPRFDNHRRIARARRPVRNCVLQKQNKEFAGITNARRVANKGSLLAALVFLFGAIERGGYADEPPTKPTLRWKPKPTRGV